MTQTCAFDNFDKSENRCSEPAVVEICIDMSPHRAACKLHAQNFWTEMLEGGYSEMHVTTLEVEPTFVQCTDHPYCLRESGHSEDMFDFGARLAAIEHVIEMEA